LQRSLHVLCGNLDNLQIFRVFRYVG
jgi:hypothetical protein